PFRHGSRELCLGFGSNYYALQPGVGGYLFLQWLKAAPIGFVFGASTDALRILAEQRWTFFPGVKTLSLNQPRQIYAGEPWWRARAKRLWPPRRPRLPELTARFDRAARPDVAVEEEDEFTEDLLPATSPFAFHFAPDLAYLKWRYGRELTFARYRLYRIRT